MADWGAVNWVALASLALGGIGTLLGVYNALAQREERREKLVISWLKCTMAEALFTEVEIGRIDEQYQRARQVSSLPEDSATAWVGTLKERFIQAEILLRNKGGKEIIVGEIRVDDWVFGERAQEPSLPGVIERDFRAFDLERGTPVNLCQFVCIPPNSTVGRRIEMYERSRYGPLLPAVSSKIGPLGPEHPWGPGQKTEILLQALSDDQPRILLQRIPVTRVERIPSPPEWMENSPPWWQEKRI